jgi:hypothetical protein
MKKGIVLAVGFLWVVSGWVSPGLAQGGAGSLATPPVYRNGVVVSGGQASLLPTPFVVDSFPSSAPSYSMGLAFDGLHIWNDEAFSHWFGEMDTQGNLLRTFAPSEGNRDMTFDGRYIWATDWSTLNVTKYDTTDGSIVASFPAPFSGHPDGLAWDGHYLWVGEENGRIYHVDTTMQLLRSIPAPNSNGYNPRGLAFDGNDLWVGNQTPGIIYRVDTISGAIQEQFSSPAREVQQGLEWDGRYLWCTGGYNWIYKMDTQPVGVQERPLGLGLRASIRVIPTPFVSYARVPGHEAERFSLYDISGRKVGTYRGDRIGVGLGPGVYFLRPQDGSTPPVGVVKVR